MSSSNVVPSKISVYRIKVYSEGSNSHSTARDERWEVIKHDEEYECLPNAKVAIINLSRQHTELPNFIQSWKETKIEDRAVTLEDLIDGFCFSDDKYLKYRRFFIGVPLIRQIQQQLRTEGINVIRL